MKKVWSILLALAMVLSCVSAVSLFTGAEGENEWSENLFAGETSPFDPTFESYENGATPEGIGGVGSPTLKVVAADALKFSATYSFHSPQIADTKALVAAAAGTENDVTVRYSIDVFMVGDSGKPGYGQIENAFGTVVRNAVVSESQNWMRVAEVVSVFDEWVTSTGEITITAEAFANEDLTFDFMLDSLGRKVGYVCNPDIRIKNEDGTYGENLVTDGLDAFTMSGASDQGVEAVGPKVLNVRSPYAWSAPLFAGKTLIRDYTADKEWESVEVEYSVDVLLPADATIRPYIRAYDANDGHKALGETVTGTGEWVTVTGNMTVTAEEIAEDAAWNFTFDTVSASQFDLDNVTLRVRKEAEEPVVSEEPTASAEPTPSYAQVVNGDAESGTQGWMAFTNGKIVQVTPGANGTAHAIEYREAGNKWGSIGFDLGPAIIQDKEAGYNGAGAGTYTITFWAKAEAGKGGKFNFLLNSKWHKLSRDIQALGGDYADAKHGTLLTFEPIDMTDEWQKFEIEFEVPETFLDQLVKLYHDDAVNTPDIYTLLLRLDGSVTDGAWADGKTFSYRVDEVELKVPQNTGSSHQSGDVLPIALIAVLAVTVTAMSVMVIRKKKEQ